MDMLWNEERECLIQIFLAEKASQKDRQMGTSNKNMFSRCENSCIRMKKIGWFVLFTKQMKIYMQLTA